VSTFFGLETAKRALTAQQNALYTVGQNVANANTDGYTRQRVNLQASDPYPAASMNRPAIAGQLGTGVEAGEVQRIRDKYLDVQYR
jgi:flagellar hook-associated protein 1 FlgK